MEDENGKKPMMHLDLLKKSREAQELAWRRTFALFEQHLQR